MSSKYSAPRNHLSLVNLVDNSIVQFDRRTSFEKVHSLIYFLRFFLLNKWIFINIIIIQIFVSVAIVYFSPKVYKASCTILPNVSIGELAEFGINYKPITSNRFIAFSKSDMVFGQSISMIKAQDHLKGEDAVNLYNRSINFSQGNEGEISIEFIHTNKEFSEKLVNQIIQNCHKVNRLIIKQNLAETYLRSKNKLNDVNLNLESYTDPISKYEITQKLNLINESIFLKRKIEIIESLTDTKNFDNYFSLNKLNSSEHNQFGWPKLIFINIMIIITIFYFAILYNATKMKIKSFFKLVMKSNP